MATRSLSNPARAPVLAQAYPSEDTADRIRAYLASMRPLALGGAGRSFCGGGP
jgi:hypothetical protein